MMKISKGIQRLQRIPMDIEEKRPILSPFFEKDYQRSKAERQSMRRMLQFEDFLTE